MKISASVVRPVERGFAPSRAMANTNIFTMPDGSIEIENLTEFWTVAIAGDEVDISVHIDDYIPSRKILASAMRDYAILTGDAKTAALVMFETMGPANDA